MAAEAYEFGDVTVDVSRMLVLRNGEPVSVEPKTFDVLRFLIEHRDRLVLKDELLDVVWKDTFVTPNVLTRAIAQIRKALGDDAFEAKYIETVSKRGYRFIAGVAVSGGGHRPVAAEPIGMAASGLPTAGPGTQAAHQSPPWLWVGAAAAIVAVAGAVAYRVTGRAAPSAPVRFEEPQRLTLGSASYLYPALSPDGRTLAYSSDETGVNEIYIVGLAPGSRALAITGDGGENIEAQWSPDGQWLAYASIRRGGVWIVPATGGAPRQVSPFGAEPAWSPNGRTIAFSDGSQTTSSLWIVGVDGSTPAKIDRAGGPAGAYVQPSWSHDGRVIAFGVINGPTQEIWATSPAGGLARKLLYRGAAPRFSSDDRVVYSLADDAVLAARLDASGRPLDANVVFRSPNSIVTAISFGPEGEAVLSLGRLASNIWTVDADADGPNGNPSPLTSDDVRDTWPAFAPDGRLAFTRVVAGQLPAVWLINGADRAEPMAHAPGLGMAKPEWSRDGRRLFVLLVDANVKPLGLAWADVATGRTTRVSTAVDVLMPDRSLDDRTVAFHVAGPGGSTNVWTMPLDGGPRRQITFDKEGIGYPTWSPDGRSIAVELMRGGETQVGVMSRDGGPVETLTTEPGQSWPGGWTPDGEGVVFAGQRGGVWNVYSVSRRTKAVTQWTHFTSVSDFVRYPVMSPRGDRIAFERARFRGSLWRVPLEIRP